MEGSGSRFLLVGFMQQGGVAMYPLLLCSILSVAIGLDRFRRLYRAARGDAGLTQSLRDLLAANRVADAVDQCSRAECPLARVVEATLAPGVVGHERRERALQRALSRETGRLEQFMPVLATIGSIAPFIGLFGTVLGIMHAFRSIAAAGSAGSAVVAAGIAEALVTTATGLFVAIVAVIAYNHLMTWSQNILTNTELTADELVSLAPE